MNGSDRNNTVDLSQSSAQGNRLFQESSLDWLADVAVQSRFHYHPHLNHHHVSSLSEKNRKNSISSSSNNSPLPTTPTIGAYNNNDNNTNSNNINSSNNNNNNNNKNFEDSSLSVNSSSNTNTGYAQRNDTHYRASEMPLTGHLNYSGHTALPYQFHHGTHLLGPVPNYFTNLYQYCPSSGHPTSPFLVPTPPASAPPTGRPSFFSPEMYHQTLLSASSNIGSTTTTTNNNCNSPMMLPQNLSLRSPPINHSPISPSSLSSPISSGPSTSPTRPISSTQHPQQRQLQQQKQTLSPMPRKLNNETISMINDCAQTDNRKVHEGSLKHRILRLPTIQLNHDINSKIDPAPMSAPPVPVQVSQKFFRKTFHSSYPHHNHHRNNHPQNSNAYNNNNDVNTKISNKNISNANHIVHSKEILKHLSKEKNSSEHLLYPECFKKGSCISLADGIVKRVEEMTTEDFIKCSRLSSDLKIDSSCILELNEKVKDYSVLITFAVGKKGQKFTVEAPLEHPFYVYHRGWASVSPERSLKRYGLACQKLKVSDLCISLTKSVSETNNNNYNNDNNNLDKLHSTMNIDRKYTIIEDHSVSDVTVNRDVGSCNSSSSSGHNNDTANTMLPDDIKCSTKQNKCSTETEKPIQSTISPSSSTTTTTKTCSSFNSQSPIDLKVKLPIPSCSSTSSSPLSSRKTNIESMDDNNNNNAEELNRNSKKRRHSAPITTELDEVISSSESRTEPISH